MDDLEVDDILDKPRKKGSKGKPKGKRGELEVVNLLNLRFERILKERPDDGKFMRTIGSGNRWSHGSLSKSAQDTFSGDVSVPSSFAFVLEIKTGYNDIDLVTAFDKCKELDEFLDQVSKDATRCGRRPLLLWKKDRKCRLAFILAEDLPQHDLFDVKLFYGDWICVNFSMLLNLGDEFFFKSDE